MQELINNYCEINSSPVDIALSNQEKAIALEHFDPGLSSDFIQGRLLSFISRLKRPQRILEIGTFWGYSTVCLAEGLPENGTIDTLEKEVSYRPFIEKLIVQSNLQDKVNLIFGNALDSLMQLDIAQYDLFFIDAAKKEYLAYYDIIIEDAKKEAVLIFDNVLWKGSVVSSNKKGITETMDTLNKKIRSDDRVDNFILPLRDGLNIVTVL